MNTRLLRALTGIVLFLMPAVTYSQTAPTLGTAANYVLFTTNGAMTNGGVPHLTHLTGNVGSDLAGAISGFGNVDGQEHDFDAATAACSADVLSLYSQLNLSTATISPVSPIMGNGDTLTSGVYQYPLLTPVSLNLNLVLDAQGNPGAVFIIKIDGAFSANNNSKVILANGALACNVFWQVEGLVSVGTNSTLRGTIVAHNAAINMSTLDSLEGRALSINGAVTLSELTAYTPIGCGSALLTGPIAPALNAAGTYGVFSAIGGVSSTPTTYVFGNVGSNSTTTTGFDPLNVTGTIHTPPDSSTANCAAALTIVYNYLNGIAADIDLLDPANFGYNLVLTPHTYLLSGATLLTDSVYLNAENDSNAVFVIQVTGALNTTVSSYVLLINGAQAKNVYWLVNGAVHIYDNSVFNGQIISAGAITVNTGDTLNGRALTINGAVAINGSYMNGVPVAAPDSITGPSTVCTGSTITLTDTTAGGSWSSSNTNASVNTGGIVTGVMPGIDTIMYTTATSSASKTITILPAPNAGSISGPSAVCPGSFIILTDTAIGGTWSSSNATATVTGGIVTAVGTGIDTIRYIVTNSCGTDTTAKIISVGTTPVAGTIAGPSNICMGTPVTFTDTSTGGVWSVSNPSATITPLGGIAAGITPGNDTIIYTIASSCGTVTATKAVTVTAIPDAGTITGPSRVCTGSFITLTDATTGGTWSSSNATATVTNGVVTGVNTGTDTISYTFTNSCGTATASKTISVGTIPDAGSISGPSNICMGTPVTYTTTGTGGVWTSTNASATITPSGGIAAGITPGNDTIIYTVSNYCGTVTATKAITVTAIPDAGTITGPSMVCTGSFITLTDATTGGTWSSSNATATVTNGVVTGVNTGTDTISYTFRNSCGTATANKIVSVGTIPAAGSINGPSNICVGTPATFTDANTGGVWTSANLTAAISPATGFTTGIIAGDDTILYTIVNFCGTVTATKAITVTDPPDAGTISGSFTACMGSDLVLTDLTTGGIWASSNGSASVSGGIVTPLAPGTDTISYTFTNACGTNIAAIAINVDPLPAAAIISTLPASTLCTGAMFQNFGTGTLPAASVTYLWSATGAAVWAQGTAHQYAIINFDTSGTAYVTLTASATATGCTAASTVAFTVGTGQADMPQVIYSESNLICLEDNATSYQWGYDDYLSLDSTLLTGEINQNYSIPVLDTTKFYWVISTHNDCMQKTYYIAPLAGDHRNAAPYITPAAAAAAATVVKVYPNPAIASLTVSVTTAVTGDIQVHILNLLGQQLIAAQAINNSATVNVENLPAGTYLIDCYIGGLKVATQRFIKN